MNEKNKVQIEGLIVDCRIDTLPKNNISCASVIVCTMEKMPDGSIDKAYHRVRFPISSRLNIELPKELNIPQAKNYIALTGELHYDDNKQPFIFTDDSNVSFPKKISSTKNNATIYLEGKLDEIVNASKNAATIIVNVQSSKNDQIKVPVIIDSRKNPIEWAMISSSSVNVGDIIKTSGNLRGQIFSNGIDKNIIMTTSVISKSISIKQNLQKQVKQGQHTL